jgi:hypothetical protein
MAKNFDPKPKLQRSLARLKAATLLLHEQFLNEAIVMYWLSVRDQLFGQLETKHIYYDSTQMALVEAISSLEFNEIGADLVFAYSVGTMAEWDENFAATPEQAADFGGVCGSIVERLSSPKRS